MNLGKAKYFHFKVENNYNNIYGSMYIALKYKFMRMEALR